jgi:hypothetical protein
MVSDSLAGGAVAGVDCVTGVVVVDGWDVAGAEVDEEELFDDVFDLKTLSTFFIDSIEGRERC